MVEVVEIGDHEDRVEGVEDVGLGGESKLKMGMGYGLHLEGILERRIHEDFGEEGDAHHLLQEHYDDDAHEHVDVIRAAVLEA